jgi:hypothetical protein
MQFLILGLALLVLVLLAGRAFSRANPKSLAQNLKSAAGWVLLIFCVVLTLTGRFAVAIPLAFFAFTLLGFTFPWQDALGKASKSQGQRSSVRTDMLEMVLDHDTGEMDGVVQKGPFVGRRLSQLSSEEMNQLLQEAWEKDTQTAQLLEAFMERSGHHRSYSRQSGRGPSTHTAAMTIEEAYAVLGLNPGASREEIHRAHRALMKKYHPDQGGTTYLASKINEAKDILLKHVR